jgi:hypothetical protein
MNFSEFVSPYLDRIKRGIPKGGGRPDGFDAAKFGAYMPDDGNDVAMDPGRLIGGMVNRATRGAGSFLDGLPRAATSAPGVDPRLQYAADAVFGKPNYNRDLTGQQKEELRVLQGNDRMGFVNNAPGDRRRIDLELEKLRNRQMNRGY